MAQLTEDDLYRTSTQFRLWSFSPEALSALRQSTHNAAVASAKKHDPNADCLTLEEEARLVQRYCETVRMTNDRAQWPVNVKATAVQYLKRFYLTNSCMTYPPKEIYKSVLFLASKTEGTHMALDKYAHRISTAPEQVLAPEYKIIQALRFTLDVRQPFRGLKGALMELLSLAEGQGTAVIGDKKPGDLKSEMAALAPPPSSALTTFKAGQTPTDRAQAAYQAARHVLDPAALLTDVYFLYTPPQIHLAALKLADPVLLDFYLSLKLPVSGPDTPKILSTISACADMLAAYDPKTLLSKDGRIELERKLDACRDPSTRDMVGLNAAAKRGNADEEEAADKAKRKKLEREASAKEGEDLFGPSLGKAVVS